MTAAATDVDEVLFELLTPAGRRDLAGVYRRLHDLGEVHRSQVLGRFVTSYRNVDAVLRDPRVMRTRHDRNSGSVAERGDCNGRSVAERGDGPSGRHSSRRLINSTFLMQDPPDHTRVRRLVSKAFTPRAVAGLQPTIGRILADRLDGIAAHDGTVDLMDELAFPFPVAVIGQLIGVPPADQPQFQRLVRDLTEALDLAVADSDLSRSDAAADTIVGYFRALVAERRRRPADDLVSALIAVRDEGGNGKGDDRLTEDELLSTLALLFLAGFETTTNLIGNGMHALLTHPDQLAVLRADPSAMPSAVEELLRFDTPVQLVPRVTAEPVTLPDGTVVPADRHLLVLIGAANHDPRVFTDPGSLTLNRTLAGARTATLSFGGGIHYCLGAGLARLEARLVFGALLARFPSIELAETPQWRDGLTVRGLNQLRLTLR